MEPLLPTKLPSAVRGNFIAYGAVPDPSVDPNLEGRRREGRSRSRMRAWLLVLALGAALALLLVDARRGSVFDGAFANAREAWSLAPAPPSQVHVALFDDTSVAAAADGGRPRAGMAVSWATSAKTRSSTVRYGQAREALELSASADAPCARYAFCDYVSPWFHHVVLPADSLLPDTLYYCASGCPCAFAVVMRWVSPVCVCP
jgi:hypothetical protein